MKNLISKFVTLVCLLFVSTAVKAYESSITSGSYYRLVSTAYNSERVMTDNNNFITTAEKNTSDYLQLWKITSSGTGYTIQNAVTGYYIQTSPGTSTQFHTGTTAAVFYTKKSSDNGFAFDSSSSYSGYGAIHRASGGNVVGWSYNATASYWYLEKVTLSSTQQTALSNLQSQITINSGSYYRLNSYYEGRSMSVGGNNVTTAATDASAYAQMWKLTVNETNASLVTLQNALTGEYIQTSPGQSMQYTMGTTAYSFSPYWKESSGSYTFSFKNTSGYTNYGLHCAQTQSYNVVGWSYTADASYWTLEEVTLTSAQQAELDNITANIGTDYTTTLLTFFSDYACTTLKSSYASMSDANLRTAMANAGLPTAVQNMAVYVKKNTWDSSKNSTWNSYAKDFRIHDYEIFSNCDLWYNKLKIGRFAHLFHPTGIKVSAGEFIYLYVNDVPTDGYASLQAEFVAGTDREGSAYNLRKGYNAIYAPIAGELFISYLLNDVDKSCNNYPDIKVHIEGGTMNGCFDMRGHGHTNEDWAWLKANMFSDEYLHVKGNSVLLNVHLSEVTGESNAVGVMNIWDYTFRTLESLTGCDSYKASGRYKMMVNCFRNDDQSTNPFWNDTNHGSSHPYLGYDNGKFNYSSLSNIDTQGGTIWEIAHELGHGFQTPINVAGCTEATNNSLVQCLTLLAKDNIGTNMFQSTRSSRGEGVNGMVSRFNSGYSWIDMGSMRTQSGTYSDLWLANRFFYQLWLYFDYMGKYQPAGGNTGFSFMSALYERLRQDGLVHSWNKENPGLASNDYLKIAQYASQITQTDLREFFQAWGFWELAPTVSNTNDDASTSTWYMGDYYEYYVKTDESYVTTVQNIMAQYPTKAGNIMFVEDRCAGSPLATYNGSSAASFGDTGYYGTFDDKITSGYTCTASYSGTGIYRTYKLKMSGGTGAVGFKVYDASGNLVAIGNTSTFNVSQDVYNGVKNGTYTVKAAQGDGKDYAMGETYTSATGIPYILKYGDTEIGRISSVEVEAGEPASRYMPMALQNYSANFADWVTYTYSPETITSNTTEVTVTATWNGPFQISSSYNNAHWYCLQLGENAYVHYASSGTPNVTLPTTLTADEAEQWAFMGDPYNGFTLINKAAGSSLKLVSDDPSSDGNTGGSTYATMQNSGTYNTWFVVPAKSNDQWYTTNGFFLYNADGAALNKRGNDNLAYWTGGADLGSTFNALYVPVAMTAPSQLTSSTLFTMNCARGYVCYNGSGLAGTTTATSASKFALVTYANHTYLYDATNKAFVCHTTAATAGTTGNAAVESNEDFSKIAKDISFGSTEISSYPWYIQEDEFTNWLNMDGTPLVYLNRWTNFESGNGGNTYNVTIVDVEFDPSEAIAMLDAYFNPNATATYVISDANGVVYTSEAVPATIGATISTLPSDYQRAYCSYTVTPTTIANGSNTVPVTVTYSMPFEVSADYASAKWYVMSLRGKWLSYGTSTPYTGSDSYDFTNESQQWAFIGTPYGIKIINKAAGAGKYLSYDSAANNINPYMKDTDTSWVLDQNNSGFVFRMPEDNNIYMHLRTPNLSTCSVSEWAAVHNDAGSTLAVLEVPDVVVDVTYNLVENGTTVNTIVVEGVAGNSAVAVPSSLTSGYSTTYYTFPTSGTIGTTDCTITVTATPQAGVVTSVSGLSNNKAYRLTTERGTLGTNGTTLVSTAKDGFSASDFAIISYDGNYYLYSVTDSKFLSHATTPALTDDLSTIETLVFNAESPKPFFFMGMGTDGVNISSGYAAGLVVNSWTTRDGGNQYVIIENADFDPTAVIATLDAYFHPANSYNRVEAEILPYIYENPANVQSSNPAPSIGTPFGLSAAAATQIKTTYGSQIAAQQFSEAEYNAAKAIFTAGLLYPEDGKTYLVKNTYNNKYLRVAEHATRGQVFADLTAEEAAQDASAHIKVAYTDNKPYMLSQGNYFNWVYGTGYEAWTSASLDKYAHFVCVGPGVGAFSIALGNGEGDYAYGLNPGFYALKDGTTTVAGSTTDYSNEYAQWIFEEITSIEGDLNGDTHVDIVDLNILIGIIFGTNNPADYNNADLNGDNTYSVGDVTRLVNLIRQQNGN